MPFFLGSNYACILREITFRYVILFTMTKQKLWLEAMMIDNLRAAVTI